MPAVSTFAEPLIRRLTPQQFRLYTPITVLQREPALQLNTIYRIFDHSSREGSNREVYTAS